MRVSNNDQVLLALRAQLERLQKQKKAEQSGRVESSVDAPKSATERVQEVLAKSDLSERQMGRILIQSLLEQEFGSRVANDPALAALSEKILAIIDREPATQKLLTEALQSLRAEEACPSR